MLQSTWLEWPSRNTIQHILLGVVVGVSISSSLVALRSAKRKSKPRRLSDDQPIQLRQDGIVRGVAGLIGMLRALPLFPEVKWFRKHAFGSDRLAE